MRFWFASSSEVPIYRQLATQVTLAIVSGELRPGDRLPSTRELARRFALHPNTISAGYKLLEREGWTEYRHGSGVYVCSQVQSVSTPEQQLDLRIAEFFRTVRELKLPGAAVRERVAQWLVSPPPDHFLVIEGDAEARQILMAEVGQLTPWKALGAAPDDAELQARLAGAVPLCRPSREAMVRAVLPVGVELVTLPINSARVWLTPWLRLHDGQLVGVVSHWPEFLSTARTMLVAAGLPAEALLFKNAGETQWRRGLGQCAVILCDAYTATLPELPEKPHRIVFPLLAGTAAAELRQFTRG